MVGTYLESQQKYGPRSGRVHRQVYCLRCGGLQKARTDGSAQFRGVPAGDSLLATGCSASLAGCQVRPNGGICSPVVRPTPRVPVVLLEPSACANTSHDPIGLAAPLQTNTDTKEPRSLEETSAPDLKADAVATYQAENTSYTDRRATLPHQPPSIRAGALGTRSGFSQLGTLWIAVAPGTGWLTSIRSVLVAGAALPPTSRRWRYSPDFGIRQSSDVFRRKVSIR